MVTIIDEPPLKDLIKLIKYSKRWDYIGVKKIDGETYFSPILYICNDGTGSDAIALTPNITFWECCFYKKQYVDEMLDNFNVDAFVYRRISLKSSMFNNAVLYRIRDGQYGR